jgi:hypothetical protein
MKIEMLRVSPAYMNASPPPIPTPPLIDADSGKFARNAAMFSLAAPLIAFCIGLFVQPQVRGIRVAMIAFGLTQMLLILSGFVLGIVAWTATRRIGREGILGTAIAGTCINGLLILLSLMLVPALKKAAERAKRTNVSLVEARGVVL